MELAYAIPADAAEIGSSGKISLLGGDFENIFVAGFPAVHTRFDLVAKLIVLPSECDRTHRFLAVMHDPDGDVRTPEVATSFTPTKVPGAQDRSVKFFVVLTFPVVLFLREGEHRLRLFVDDKEVGSVPLRVIEQKSSKSPAFQHQADSNLANGQ